MPYCTYCHRPLEESIRIGNYKSCPNCSQLNPSQQHIFRPNSDFGTTPARATINNPDGIQSYCSPCRSSAGINLQPGIPCSQINQT